MSTQLLTKSAAVIVSLAIGFTLGSRPLSNQQKTTKDNTTPVTDGKHDPILQQEILENPQEDEDAADGDLSAIKPKMFEQCKMVLVVRTDLKMKPGDVSRECATATLACYKALSNKNPQLVRHWEVTGQAKIALQARTEEQLLELDAIAKSLNLCSRLVHSKTLANRPEETVTVLGIGPAPVELVNQVTGKLRLF